MRKSHHNIGYFIAEGFRSIFTHGLMSFAAVFMIVACLLIMGSFSLVALNLERQLGELERENEFLAFVDENYTREQALALKGALERVDNVSSVTFTTREEAKANYAAKYADDKNASLYTELPDEVFRDRYSVHVFDLSLLSETIELVEAVEGIEGHQAAPEVAEGFVLVRNVATGVALVLAALLLIISLFIIYNTIKLGTFTRREEIAIMKMCGATNGFVRAPFIVEGMILGLFGGVVAFFCQWGVYELILRTIDTGPPSSSSRSSPSPRSGSGSWRLFPPWALWWAPWEACWPFGNSCRSDRRRYFIMSQVSKKPKQKRTDRRRVMVTVLCILMALALILPLLSTALLSVHAITQTELKSQISDLKNSASSAAAKKKEIENQLAAIRSDKAKAMERKNLLAQQLAAIDTEILNTNNQIVAYTALIGEQETALADAQARLDYAYERFYQRARSMEESGSFSYLSVLFLANSWSDLLDRLALVDEIMVYDNSVVDDLTSAKEQVELVLADLRETQAGLEEQRALQDAQRAEQAAKVNEAEAVLRELKQDEAQAQALHEAAEAEKKQLEAQIAKKEKEYKALVAAANFTTGSGYVYPLPSSYIRISSGFKWRNCPFHGREHHNGIDLPAPTGVKVSAVQGGVVIISTYAPSSYGNYIMIDHGNGRSTLYGHLSSRSVKEGDIVKQGQTIGLVGSTGSSTAPHLHLELKVNGVRRDPKTLFPGVKFTGDLESN